MNCTRDPFRTLIAAKLHLYREQQLAGQKKRWRGLVHYCSRCSAWHIYDRQAAS